MKCTECPDYRECVKNHNLTIKRKNCPKAKEKIKLTNADRIRSMNDYELSVFLSKVRAMVYRADLPVIAYSTKDMAENLEWLQQPAEVDPCT